MNRLSRSRGAAGGASPESTVLTYGLVEDRAVSGIRRLREASRAWPHRVAGRERESG